MPILLILGLLAPVPVKAPVPTPTVSKLWNFDVTRSIPMLIELYVKTYEDVNRARVRDILAKSEERRLAAQALFDRLDQSARERKAQREAWESGKAPVLLPVDREFDLEAELQKLKAKAEAVRLLEVDSKKIGDEALAKSAEFRTNIEKLMSVKAGMRSLILNMPTLFGH